MFWSDMPLSHPFEPRIGCQTGLSWFSPRQQHKNMRFPWWMGRKIGRKRQNSWAGIKTV